MASPYSRVLRRPGALRFSTAGLVARFPMSMVGISTILAVQSVTGEYRAAGLVSAVNVVATAVGSPVLARLVDTHGQRRVMLPAVLVSSLGLVGLVAAATAHAPLWALAATAAVSGGFGGSFGALVRSRWSMVLTTPDEIHTAFSLEAALDEVVFVIGPVLATALCTSPLLPVTSGWVVALVMQVSGALWLLSQRATEPPPRAHRDGADGAPTSRRAPVLASRAVLVVIAVFLLSGVMFGANDVAVVARAEELGARSAAGTVLAFFGGGSLVAALVYGARSWSWPLWKQFVVGTVALAVGASTFMAAHHLALMALFMLLTGMTIAPTITTGNNIVQVSVPAHSLTEGLAWVGTAMNVGVSLGSLVGGTVLDASGSDGGYLVVALAGWAAALAAVAGARTLRRAQPVRTLG